MAQRDTHQAYRDKNGPVGYSEARTPYTYMNNTYHPRKVRPEKGNNYYIRTDSGGWNPACVGKPKDELNDVLANCVGYAVGRFNEIGGYGSCKYISPVNPKQMATDAKYRSGLSFSNVPKLGALMVWGPLVLGKTGHVAIVEEVISVDEVVTSESGYKAKKPFWTTRRTRNQGGFNESWGQSADQYYFAGFIHNPAVPDSSDKTGTVAGGGALTEKEAIEYVDKQVTVTKTVAQTVDTDGLNRTKTTSLLTYPTLVESPFIIVKMGDYTFGSYVKDGSTSRLNSNYSVTYPNYMNSVSIIKTNGTVNQYTLTMVYQIAAGQDPNLLDKIFSSVGYGTIKISYGDWEAPAFIYKEEEALITQVKSKVDFQSSRITYTISCTSTALSLISDLKDFPPRYKRKPSDIIKEMLYTSGDAYGLLEIFNGMKNPSLFYTFVAGDDKAVDIPAKSGVDALSYINYLVTYMTANTNADGSVLQDSSYYLTIEEDEFGEYGGSYFKITKVTSTNKTLATQNVYEVDIGYPQENLIMDFSITDDNSWSLLYNYADKINTTEYVYEIDNQGNLLAEYSPGITTSNVYKRTTNSQKSWWTKMTQFPITATLTLKGLLRPAVLMTYVRVNAFFYGQRHVSSGLYVITKQEDKIDGNGYRTTLSLTRVAGDEDVISTVTTTETVKVAQKKLS